MPAAAVPQSAVARAPDGADDADPLPVLLAAVRHRRDRRRPARRRSCPADFPTNRGGLCSKGWTAAELLDHPERLLTPAGPRDARRPHQPAASSAPGTTPSTGSSTAIQRTQQRHGRDAVGCFGGGGADQREGLPVRQVRPGRAAHQRHRLQRPVLHVLGRDGAATGRSASTAACRSRWPTSPRPTSSCWSAATRPTPCRRRCSTSTQGRAARRPAHRGRPAAHRHRRAAPRLHLQPLPGTDLALANGLLHIAIREGLVDEAYVAARTTGFDAVRAGGRARTGRTGWSGSPASPVGRPAAHRVRPGRAPSGDDPHRPRRRAAQQRHRHRPGLHQPRARPRPARPAGQRLRHRSPARATGRAAASTGRRPTSCPATGGWTTRPPARTSPRSGASTPTSCRCPGKSAFELLDRARHRRRRPHPAGAGLQRRGLAPRTPAGSSAG